MGSQSPAPRIDCVNDQMAGTAEPAALPPSTYLLSCDGGAGRRQPIGESRPAFLPSLEGPSLAVRTASVSDIVRVPALCFNEAIDIRAEIAAYHFFR